MYDNLPFTPPEALLPASPAATDAPEYEGMEFIFWDETYKGRVRLKLVRNVSGISLERRRLATFKTLLWGKQIDGYADVHTEFCRPIWHKHSINIVNNDFCYLVMEGPAEILTTLVGDATTVLNEGDWVVNATAASNQATTAGRVRLIDMTGATAPLGNQIMNRVGRCLTARTTNNTDTSTLIWVGHGLW